MATVKRTIIIKSTDNLGNETQKAMAHANPNATAANIDTFARAINGLTKNTYGDTLIQDVSSVNEILAE